MKARARRGGRGGVRGGGGGGSGGGGRRGRAGARYVVISNEKLAEAWETGLGRRYVCENSWELAGFLF